MTNYPGNVSRVELLKSAAKRRWHEFQGFRIGLRATHKVRKLIRLGRLGIRFGLIPGSKGHTALPINEWRFKSLIYTLFVSNVQTATLLKQLDNLDVPFSYSDAKLLLRAMFERVVNQSYIMTDPERLGYLFALWRSVEEKRYHDAWVKVAALNDESHALRMQLYWSGAEWDRSKEEEFLDAVGEWEMLVSPKQSAEKARNWSGTSIGQMAEQCGLGDYYRLFYRQSSWFAHGLTFVSDMFIKPPQPEKPDHVIYDFSPSQWIKLECYLQTYQLLRASFITTNNVLSWGLQDRLADLDEDEGSAIIELGNLLRDHFSPF